MHLWILSLIGLVAVVVSAVSVALGTNRRTLTTAFVSCILTLVANTATIVLALGQRLRIDKNTDQAIIDAAEVNARTISKFGLVFGVVALVLALIVLIRGVLFNAKDAAPSSMRKPRADDEEPTFEEISESPRSLAALVIGCLTVFSLAAAGMPLILSMPKPKIDPASQTAFNDAAALFEEGQFEKGCAAVEKALGDELDPKLSGRQNDVDAFTTECFELYLSQALSTGDAEVRKAAVARLTESKLPLTEAQSARRDEALAATP